MLADKVGGETHSQAFCTDSVNQTTPSDPKPHPWRNPRKKRKVCRSQRLWSTLGKDGPLNQLSKMLCTQEVIETEAASPGPAMVPPCPLHIWHGCQRYVFERLLTAWCRFPTLLTALGTLFFLLGCLDVRVFKQTY